MHGGTITWDPQKNIVDHFFMPEEKITNQIAHDNGHIAIKTENGIKTASVSYSPMTSQTEDEEGNNVGQLIVKNIYVNGVAYPLRKVGFNQFWSGKSLHNITDNNGKALECFNTQGEVGDVNACSLSLQCNCINPFMSMFYFKNALKFISSRS